MILKSISHKEVYFFLLLLLQIALESAKKWREQELTQIKSYVCSAYMDLNEKYWILFHISWRQDIVVDKIRTSEFELTSNFIQEWNKLAKTSIMEKLSNLPLLQGVSSGFPFLSSLFEFAWMISQPTFCWFLMSQAMDWSPGNCSHDAVSAF